MSISILSKLLSRIYESRAYVTLSDLGHFF